MVCHLTVARSGLLTTLQDGGRRGYAHLAVPRSGALDPQAMRLANRLVGNSEDCAVLETTLDGVSFSLDEDRIVAATGAYAPIQVGGKNVPSHRAVHLPANQLLDVGPPLRGVRSYIAVAGGVLGDLVMGSRSTDLLSRIGPPPLAAGSRIEVGVPALGAPPVDVVPHSEPPDELNLLCYLGPRDDELRADSIEEIAKTSWRVTSESNRIGLRLHGPPLRRRDHRELSSEPLVLGSLQVPPDGQPVLFLADHPSTGGYPVVGVVPEPDIWRCAQAIPGSRIRFHLLRLRRP